MDWLSAAYDWCIKNWTALPGFFAALVIVLKSVANWTRSTKDNILVAKFESFLKLIGLLPKDPTDQDQNLN